MVEKTGSYPVYEATNTVIAEQKVSLSLTYAQLLEIANVFYFVNQLRIPKWLGGLKLDEAKRALHKAIHNSAVNCCLSLEEKYRYEKEGGNREQH